MKYSKLFFLIVTLSFLSSSIVFAKYYSYTDSNGVKHFTDNLLEVPIDQRPQLNIHSGVQAPAKEEKPGKKEKPDSSENQVDLEFLQKKKEELDLEYAVLSKNREELMNQKASLKPDKYNELARNLNAKMKKYQEKHLAYETLVDQYNRQESVPQKTE